MDMYFYYLFSPSQGFVDDGQNPPAFEHTADWLHKKYQWSVFADDNGRPVAARLLAEGLPDHELPKPLEPLVTMLVEHTLAVLRLTWDPSAAVLPLRFASERRGEDGIGVTLAMKLPALDAKAAALMFECTLPMRETLRLFSDAVNETIPIQFRFLSYYKMLELHCKDDFGHWDNGKLSRSLACQHDAYALLKRPASFIRELHDLRDRCAHIKTGHGKKQRLGVTSLSHEAAREVGRLMPLLKVVGTTLINHLAGGSFKLEASPEG